MPLRLLLLSFPRLHFFPILRLSSSSFYMSFYCGSFTLARYPHIIDCDPLPHFSSLFLQFFFFGVNCLPRFSLSSPHLFRRSVYIFFLCTVCIKIVLLFQMVFPLSLLSLQVLNFSFSRFLYQPTHPPVVSYSLSGPGLLLWSLPL